MGVVILPLAIGVALGLIVAIWQTIRISTGANTKIIRNPDGSVYHPVGTIIGIFILWSLVCSVIAFIMLNSSMTDLRTRSDEGISTR